MELFILILQLITLIFARILEKDNEWWLKRVEDERDDLHSNWLDILERCIALKEEKIALQAKLEVYESLEKSNE